MSKFQNELVNNAIERNTSIEQDSAISHFQDELADIRASAFKESTNKNQREVSFEVALNRFDIEANARPRTAAEMVKEATEKFDKEKDKTKAIKELRKEFDAAIKKADEELAAIRTRVLPDLNALANEMADAMEKVNPAVQGVFEKVRKLEPEAQRNAIQVKVARYLHMPPHHADYQNLRTEFAKYPGMLPAADLAARELKAAQPIFRKYDPPAIELWDAGIQAYRAREEFAKRLKEANCKPESDALMKEAGAVLEANHDPARVVLDAREQMKRTLKQFDNAIPKR